MVLDDYPNLSYCHWWHVCFGNFTFETGHGVTFKSNTKFFGKPTAGLTTGNQMFILSDSSVIVLTTAIYMDRNDNLLGGKIWPDVFCETSKPKNSVLQSTNIDITIEKVISWINEN